MSKICMLKGMSGAPVLMQAVPGSIMTGVSALRNERAAPANSVVIDIVERRGSKR